MNSKIVAPVIAGLVALGALSVYALQNPQRLENLNPVAAMDPRIDVPAGTPMRVRLETSLSTKTASVGDRFTATVAAPVRAGGAVAIPAGATVSGRVIVAEQPGKASGRGKLQLLYEEVSYAGRSYDLDSRSQLYLSRSGTSKDVKLIGGGAVAGGVIGGIIGGSAGDAAKGAGIGAVAGTGASLATRGPQLELGRGTTLSFTLDRSLSVKPAPEA